jgi:hypothetical protein
MTLRKESGVEQQPSKYLGGTRMPLEELAMKSLWWHRWSRRVAANWTCAILCVFVLCSAAHAQPSISGFLVNGVAATGGPIGANLTIQGSGFGATRGFSTATLNGIAIAGNGVTPVSWSNTAIVVVIPTNATSGPVVVTVKNKASNSVNFTVSPAINSLSPVSGERGTSVTIGGANFATQPGNTVTFNGVPTTASSWSSSRIVAAVPWTTSGNVVVRVGSATSNGVTFTIAAPPPTGTPGTGTFFVNRTDDPAVPVDASGSPLLTQFCQNTSNTDMSSPCSLREAVVETNGDANDSSLSPDTIMLAAGTYHLSITGTGTLDATTGHLDITNPVTIVGTGASTIIQADASLQDQIFLIDAAEEGSIGFPVAISNLVIQGGQVNPNTGLVTSGGAFMWEAGTNGTGQLRLTNVNINGNSATDPGMPGLDDGGAMALFNTAGVTTPAQVTITGSTIQNNQALDAGGGIALKGAISLTMSSSIVTGNRALGGGTQQGGGLFFQVSNNAPVGATSSPSLIQNSTISANVAGSGSVGEGGGVFTDQSLTINQGSVISGNTAGGAGGGIATRLAGANDQVVITSSTITGNSTSGSGGGIEIDANSNANLQLTFNRIVGNSASGGGSGLSNLGTGTVSATDNWWGCSQGPQTSGNGCDNASGTVTSSPWITLTNTASPSVVLNGMATTLTASFLQDSASTTLSASNLTPLIGLTVSYPRTINGTLSQQQTTIQPTGTATATLTATGTPTASSDAKVDNDTQTANVTVQDFSVSVGAATVNFGSSTASMTVTVTSVSGFSGVVTLACGAPMPAGITCVSFNPPTLTPPVNGSATSTLSVNIDSTVAPGTYSIPVTGTSGGASRSGSGNLTLADFQLIITPPTQTILLGQSATFTITCSSSSGFSGSVQLNSNPSATINPNPMPCPGSSTITVTPTTSGTFTLTVTGTAGTLTRTVTATLVVQDFSVTVAPAMVNFGSSSVSFTVTVTSINGFNGVVTLGCNTTLFPPQDAGFTCPPTPFNPPTVTPPVNGSATSTWTVNIASSVAAGTYSIPMSGTSSGVTRNAFGNVTLATFSLSISPASQTINFGQTATYTVTCSTITGFNGPVQLSSNIAVTTFDSNPLNCPGQTLIHVTPNTAGNLTLVISGIFGTAPAVTTSAGLNVNQVILRPTVFTAQSGGYTSPANAADGNSSTFSAGPTSSTSSTGEEWSGFGSFSGTPSQLLLKVTSSAACDSGSGLDGITLQWGPDNTFMNDSLIYQMGLFGGQPSVNRPLTTDVISLPVTTNTANMHVFSIVYSPSLLGCHKIYDIWIEATF